MLTAAELTWTLHSLFVAPDEDTAQRHLGGGLAKPSPPALAKTCIPKLDICFSAPPTPTVEGQVSSQTHVSGRSSRGSIHSSSCSAVGWGALTSEPKASCPHLGAPGAPQSWDLPGH